VVLGRCVGQGHYKDVYRIRGHQQVLKLLKEHSESPRAKRDILLEVDSEAKLRELDIDVATTRDHDPEGCWIITDYVPDRTIAELIRTRSPSMVHCDLVEATAHVIERLRGVDSMMDMGTPNWAFRNTATGPRLIALEAAIKPHNGDPLWFERIYLPLWTMHLADVRLEGGSHRDSFRIDRGNVEKLRAAWAHEETFTAWRGCFGQTLPELGRPWVIVESNERRA